MSFVHLHNHTQYSMLDGACRVDKMVALAKEMGHTAVAMTDHGNMFGTIHFNNEARKAGLKPLIGSEMYLIDRELDDELNKQDTRYHLVLLAMDLTGYRNLCKLSSYSYLQGFYKKPRISKSLLKKYSQGLIVLSACVQGELPYLLLRGMETEAYKALDWYKEVFGDRFYIELQNHGLENENEAMPKLIEMAQKTNTPMVITNDCHYLKKEDHESHDILLCIQTQSLLSDEKRMSFELPEFYFKSEQEMRGLFPQHPEAVEQAIANTQKVADRIDFELKYDHFIFPKVDAIPADCDTPEKEQEWLAKHIKELCYQQIPVRYGEITDEIKERLDFELSVIDRMGYNSYFLIVKDFIDAARDMGIPVGPGRGSAAGSIVSYLLDITRLDPIKYGLLFERFLDVERVGMPDIDIDFCARGRSKVIDYVVDKYGRNSVTQIVTYSKLGARSVVKDVARTLEVPAADANNLTKLMPGGPKSSLDDAMKESPEFAKKVAESEIYQQVVRHGGVLEGLIRQVGVHAAGVVIGPGDLTDYVPLCTARPKGGNETVVLVQYEGKWLDDLKMLKMDFLGLQTLTHIKLTCDLVKKNHNVDIDPETLPLDDVKTYQLLSAAQTDGIFQFESKGMKRYLAELKPNLIEDLIAMVALFRPGPMQFIDDFIKRKHGEAEIVYDHPDMEDILAETYGVTVYQEQVMRLAKKLAGFTSGEAGRLRKAIGKKNKDILQQMEEHFIGGCVKNGVSQAVAQKIWADWQQFANYAFNKSHAACYALVSYRTAYLKAHYPLEFMAALLTLEENPQKIPYFIEECRNINIEVVPPCVNESMQEFSVREGKIVFGLRGIKNVGDAAIGEILAQREKDGAFIDIFDLAKRVNTMTVNKTTFESLIKAGAFDCFTGNRAQQMEALPIALEYAAQLQAERESGQLMLFDDFSTGDDTPIDLTPKLPQAEPWPLGKMLEEEKTVLGFYISGHPLSRHKHLLELVVNTSSVTGANSDGLLRIIGIVQAAEKRKSQKGNMYLKATLEDMEGTFEVIVYESQLEEWERLFVVGNELYLEGFASKGGNAEETTLGLRPRYVAGLDNLGPHFRGELRVKLPYKSATKHTATQLLNFARSTPGNLHFVFNVETPNFGNLRLESRKVGFFPNKQMWEFMQHELQAEVFFAADN